jgi:RHS repeat-associated protein
MPRRASTIARAALTELRNANALATLSYADYGYDAVGNPTSIVTSESSAVLSYDNRDRLAEVCYQSSCPGSGDPFIRYAYDAVGNRSSETRPAGASTYSYDAADQITSVATLGGTVTYGFDSNGNETQAGAKTYAYDLAGRLTSANDGTTTVAYSYDGDGNRLLASTGVAASQKTNYLWDVNNGLPQLALERDGDSAVLRDYLYGNGVASMDAGAATHYFHRDGIGSIANVTSSTGSTEWTYSYEPYGSAKTAAQDDPSAPTNLLRFAGEYLDPASGLVNLRARQYDTATGRFLSVDPRARSLTTPSIGSYVYADDRPSLFIDPSGMGPIWTDERGCLGLGGNVRCGLEWGSDPNNLWDPVRAGAAAAACAEGGLVGFKAGPWGAAFGCVALMVAFDYTAERAKEKATHPDE